jgi:dihydropteroate synthase
MVKVLPKKLEDNIRIIDFNSNEEFKKFLLEDIKVDQRSIKFFERKNKIFYIYLRNIEAQFCNIIKQEMLSCGGDAAVSSDVSRFIKKNSNILIFGTYKNIEQFIEKSKYQIKPIAEIGKKISEIISNYEKVPNLKINKKKFDFKNKIYIMGILNITPDSFYDGGKYFDKEIAIERAFKLVEEGADIIDIGGQSTRPGSDEIPVKEELKRVLPVLKAIRKKVKVLISVDTYKSAVALEALKEGADIINDISGLKFDKNMAKIISKYNAGVVIMHIKGTPKTMQINPEYDSLISEIIQYLNESIKIAIENGIDYDKIIIDPGIGFGKSLEDNYVIINKLKEFKIFNRPILIGLSRKSLIGKVLNQQPHQRLLGTILLNAISILNGANIIRVHDVKEHKEMIKLLSFLNTEGLYYK